MSYYVKRYPRRKLLSGVSLDDLVNALTDPKKRFEFPVKPFKMEIDLSQQTKGIIIGAAAGITIGLILNRML